MDVRKLLSRGVLIFKKHSPEVMTALGIASLLGATVLAVKATPEAMGNLEEKREEVGRDELTPKETVEATWRCYVPAGFLSIAGVGLLVGSNAVHARRSAAFAAAFTAAERGYDEYRSKVAEVAGPHVESEVAQAVARERVEKNPVPKAGVGPSEDGDDLYYDAYSGRYFKTSRVRFEACVNQANRMLIDRGYLSLNDYYEEIGLPPTKIGDDLGWNIHKSLIEPYLEPHMTPDGSPCVVVDYLAAPLYDYDEWL